MQVNSLLVRAKLVPILAIVPALCFYRLIFTKQKVIRRADYVVSVNETLFIPLFLYGAFSASLVQISFFPAYLSMLVTGFVKITEVNVFSKVWILSNFYILPELAAVTVFAYPNIVYYEKPFKKFTKIFFKQNPTIAIKTYKIAKRSPDKKILYRKPVFRHRPLFHYATYTLVKLRLFDYVSFYS